MGSCVAFGKKLLQDVGLTLQRCIDTCQSAETMATQMKPMGGKVDVNALSQRIKQNKNRPVRGLQVVWPETRNIT